MEDGCANGNLTGLNHKSCRVQGYRVLAVIHFISNNQSNLEKQLLQFAEAHSFEIEIHPTIEDFLLSYGENRQKERQIKYENFQEWMGRFHLVLGCWETKRKWREVKQHLRTWEPRIISRFTSSNREYFENRLKNIFGVGVADSMSVEYLKKKYMVGLKRKFATIIAMTFRSYLRAQAVSAENEKTLPLKEKPVKSMHDPLQYKRLRLVKTLSEICDKKIDETETGEFRKPFPKGIPETLRVEDNKCERDRWFKSLNEARKLHPLHVTDYLPFFDHCPWCLSEDIELTFFKSPLWTWSGRCGRAGWVVRCTGCQEVLLFDLVAMS